MLQKEIENILANHLDPYVGKDWLTTKSLKKIEISPTEVQVALTVGYPCRSFQTQIEQSLQALIAPLTGGVPVKVVVTSHIDAHAGGAGVQGLSNIKNIIAVASGKGGVGKSTIAVNLALALAREGAAVGLLDADIYGPSQPVMLGTQQEKPLIKDKTITPIRRHGIQSMSIGYLVDLMAPMVWRGPMLGKALQQLLNDTQWQALDYLIVDLPPGTGDVQLTLCQKIPVSGAVMVTTPQDLALLDVRRACEMFYKMNVPILGIVENMSAYHCTACGHETPIFGEGGAAKLAASYHMDLLGSVALNHKIREMTDSGEPPVVQGVESDYAKPFYEIARRVAGKLVLQTKDYTAKFPKIVVEPAKKGSPL